MSQSSPAISTFLFPMMKANFEKSESPKLVRDEASKYDTALWKATTASFVATLSVSTIALVALTTLIVCKFAKSAWPKKATGWCMIGSCVSTPLVALAIYYHLKERKQKKLYLNCVAKQLETYQAIPSMVNFVIKEYFLKEAREPHRPLLFPNQCSYLKELRTLEEERKQPKIVSEIKKIEEALAKAFQKEESRD